MDQGDQASGVPGQLGRRGVMAALAGLGAAILAKLSERPASASHEGPLFIGFDNIATHPTTLLKSSDAAHGLSVENTGGGAGLIGNAATFYGTIGTSVQGHGALGQADGQGVGLVGFSNQAHGVLGMSQGNGHGVVGLSPQNGAGVFGQALGPNGLAGVFFGPVVIQGSLTLNGQPLGGASASAVSSSGADQRTLVEDVGEARLNQGRSEVTLNRELVETLRGASYQVFLTEYEANLDLYVASRGRERFEVRSNGAGPASGSFGYRIVAKLADSPDRPSVNERASSLPKPLERKDLPKPFSGR
jgi:hypothetical protein